MAGRKIGEVIDSIAEPDRSELLKTILCTWIVVGVLGLLVGMVFGLVIR